MVSTRQSTVLRGFVDSVLRLNPTASIVALGDLDDVPFSPALAPLTGRGGLVDLITTLPPGERCSYGFDDNSPTLDHALTSHSILFPQYDVVQINAEFADQAGDHDPRWCASSPSVGWRRARVSSSAVACPSGRRSTPRKRVRCKPPWVQIPPLPPT